MKRKLALVPASLLLFLAAPEAAQRPVRIAILPVVVHALEGHDYLRSGLADMLASRIGRTRGVAVVRVDELEEATTDPEKAREAGRAVGADYVVYGSFTSFGAGASLDLECTATTASEKRRRAPVREFFVQSGTLGEIIPRLDGVAERLAHFALTGERSTPPVAAAPPPASNDGPDPDADLQALLERVEALEKAVYSREERVEETDLRDEGLEEAAAP